MNLVLASNNAGKLAELQALFAPLDVTLVRQSELGVGEAEEPFRTFVENALAKARHASAHTGLPAIADDAGLCVEVLDDGVGLVAAAPRPGGGVGLSNLRERLRTLHGNLAKIQLLENQDGGVTSRLILPA